MKIVYFKCTLLSDVVVNASLATEGNMQSLDYIPGSNFMGIVAKAYDDLGKRAYDILHSGSISFGDALISHDKTMSVAVPFSLFTDKLATNIEKDNVWVHHGIENLPVIDNRKVQLKQQREGYLTTDGIWIRKVEKIFNLKSAYNAKERRSAEGKMFGFDAIKKGQEFIFSVSFEDESYIEEVISLLEGEKSLGKSKSAQYGLVRIEKMNDVASFQSNEQEKNGLLVVYAESNLSFFNEYGHPTFTPKAEDFGVDGKILWDKSQIRTYSYSPWNNKRNTSTTQRDVILRGSVIVIIPDNEVRVDILPQQVGHYRTEGLGRVLYNPIFLEYGENGLWKYKAKESENNNGTFVTIPDDSAINVSTPLGQYLKKKCQESDNELAVGRAVLNVFFSTEGNILQDRTITPSQWGAIRSFAMQAKDIDDLDKKLFDDEKGYLCHGVAAERIWDKQRGKRRKTLKRVIKNNKELGTAFVAKLAAEMAKKKN